MNSPNFLAAVGFPEMLLADLISHCVGDIFVRSGYESLRLHLIRFYKKTLAFCHIEF